MKKCSDNNEVYIKIRQVIMIFLIEGYNSARYRSSGMGRGKTEEEHS